MFTYQRIVNKHLTSYFDCVVIQQSSSIRSFHFHRFRKRLSDTLESFSMIDFPVLYPCEGYRGLVKNRTVFLTNNVDDTR